MLCIKNYKQPMKTLNKNLKMVNKILRVKDEENQ